MNPSARATTAGAFRVALVNVSAWYQDGQATAIQRTGRFEVTQRVALEPFAADLLLQHQPDLIFVSVPVARPDWVETLMNIRIACPWSYVIVATAEPDWRRLANCQRDGADCVLIYPLTDAALLSALSEGVTELEQRSEDDPVFDTIRSLSPTLRRVASVLSTGASNPAIADSLCLSRYTVERHISALFRVFDVSGRVPLGAMLAGRRRGPRQTGSPGLVEVPSAYLEVH